MILVPEIANPPGTFRLKDQDVGVVYRSRQSAARLNTYNDPFHRAVGRAIAGPKLPPLTSVTGVDDLVRPRTGVMLLYPITEEKGKGARKSVTVGFTLLFPGNSIRNVVTYDVRNDQEPAEALVDAD
jgi:hypothetical protein